MDKDKLFKGERNVGGGLEPLSFSQLLKYSTVSTILIFGLVCLVGIKGRNMNLFPIPAHH